MRDYITSYEEAVELLYRIPRFNPNHSLKDISDFLTKMGRPDKQMKIIHVAGTNGKGSASAYLAGLLKQAGFKTGLFTSPHLVEVRERFRVNGEMISRELFTEAMNVVFSLLAAEAQAYKPCWFDVLFFVGMYVFAKEQTEIIVLETGLGGRLDATNAVTDKLMTLITHIGFDHMQQLGNTLEEIAAEKAGIMRAGVPCLVAPHNEEVKAVFTKKAAELGSDCRILGKEDYACQRLYEKSVAFSYFSSYYGTVPVTLHTMAEYQTENVVLALAAFEKLIEMGIVSEHALTIGQIQSVLFQTKWEGRMEEMQDGIILDGAHNTDGIRAFLESVAEQTCQGKRILIFSAVTDKDYTKMLQDIVQSQLFSDILVTQIEGERGERAEVLFETAIRLTADMCDAVQKTETKCRCVPSLSEALKTALENRNKEDYIYIVGSLYLVGCTKKLLKAGTAFDQEEYLI